MSKIEEFNKAKNVADRVADSVAKCLGLDRTDNDKHIARAIFCKITSDPFSPMMLLIDCSYGYYGSSSGYSATSPELGKYLVAAINSRIKELLDDAAGLARADAHRARIAAQEEAKYVLLTTETAAE
jgi:hypothetical protein